MMPPNFPADFPQHYDGEFPFLTEEQVTVALALLAEVNEPAVQVTLQEQSMGVPMETSHALYFGEALEELFSDGEYPGPRSTAFEVPPNLQDSAGETLYGDNDFDSVNGVAFEAYFTYYGG